jgi:hypothetical protein
MDGASSSAGGGSGASSSSSPAAVQGSRGGRELAGRVGATNIGRLRHGKQQHGTRLGVGVGISISVTSWHLRVFAAVVGLMGCLLLAASLAMSALHQVQFRNAAISRNFRGLQVSIISLFSSFLSSQITYESLLRSLTDDSLTLLIKELKQHIVRREQVEQIMHGRLLQMATSALTKVRPFDG